MFRMLSRIDVKYWTVFWFAVLIHIKQQRRESRKQIKISELTGLPDRRPLFLHKSTPVLPYRNVHDLEDWFFLVRNDSNGFGS